MVDLPQRYQLSTVAKDFYIPDPPGVSPVTVEVDRRAWTFDHYLKYGVPDYWIGRQADLSGVWSGLDPSTVFVQDTFTHPEPAGRLILPSDKRFISVKGKWAVEYPRVYVRTKLPTAPLTWDTGEWLVAIDIALASTTRGFGGLITLARIRWSLDGETFNDVLQIEWKDVSDLEVFALDEAAVLPSDARTTPYTYVIALGERVTAFWCENRLLGVFSNSKSHLADYTSMVSALHLSDGPAYAVGVGNTTPTSITPELQFNAFGRTSEAPSDYEYPISPWGVRIFPGSPTNNVSYHLFRQGTMEALPSTSFTLSSFETHPIPTAGIARGGIMLMPSQTCDVLVLGTMPGYSGGSWTKVETVIDSFTAYQNSPVVYDLPNYVSGVRLRIRPRSTPVTFPIARWWIE